MGPAHPSVASTLGALGACAVVRRRFEDADAYFRHAVGVDERAARTGRARGRGARSGFKHPRGASHLASLASTRRDRGRLAEAEALYCAAMEAWETRDRDRPTNPPRDETIDAVDVVVDASAHDDVFDPGATLNASGLSCKDQGRWAEAAQRFERAVAHGAARMRAAERAGDARAWRDASAATSARLCNLGALRARQGRVGDAAAAFHRAMTFAENNNGGATRAQAALCRGWFVGVGGVAAAESRRGRAAGANLDAVVAGEWESLDAPFEVAWGALAGDAANTASSVVPVCEPSECPVAADVGAYAERGGGDGDGKVLGPRFRKSSVAPPACHVLLDAHRVAKVASEAWRRYWDDVGDEEMCELMDGLDVDAASRRADDVAGGETAKRSERRQRLGRARERRGDRVHGGER